MILVVLLLIAIVYYIIDLFIQVSIGLANNKNSSNFSMFIFNIIIIMVCSIGGSAGFLFGLLLCGFIDFMIIITKERPAEKDREMVQKQNEYTQEYGLIENENEWW